MEGYISDEEQVQRIKSWWKKYGTAVLLVIFLFLAANFGWKYWTRYKLQRAQQASMIYEEMFSADILHKTDDFTLLAKHLIKDFSSTPYADLASLLLARENIRTNDLTAAQKNLQWVINNSGNKNFRQIARIRAARVLSSAHQYKQALATLATVDDQAFNMVVVETKGDIYLAMNQKDKALAAYQIAAKLFGNKVSNPALQMKLDELKK